MLLQLGQSVFFVLSTKLLYFCVLHSKRVTHVVFIKYCNSILSSIGVMFWLLLLLLRFGARADSIDCTFIVLYSSSTGLYTYCTVDSITQTLFISKYLKQMIIGRTKIYGNGVSITHAIIQIFDLMRIFRVLTFMFCIWD